MLTLLIDKNGDALERLKDIPLNLSFEETARGYWEFPVAPAKPGIAYEIVHVKIIDFVIESGARVPAFSFVDKAQHQAVLDFMGKNMSVV